MPLNSQIPTAQVILTEISNGTIAFQEGKSGLVASNAAWRWSEFTFWIKRNTNNGPNTNKLITWGEIITNRVL